jgi:hypothetical protein
MVDLWPQGIQLRRHLKEYHEKITFTFLSLCFRVLVANELLRSLYFTFLFHNPRTKRIAPTTSPKIRLKSFIKTESKVVVNALFFYFFIGVEKKAQLVNSPTMRAVLTKRMAHTGAIAWLETCSLYSTCGLVLHASG